MVEVVRVVAGVCLALTGCFYVDPFNNPPLVTPSCEFIDGRQCNSGRIAHRGERIRLSMVVSDADNNEDRASYGWQAFACTVDDGTGCIPPPYDAQHYDEDLASGLVLEIPASLAGDARSTSVDFEARDDRGGFDTASLVFRIADAPALVRRQPRSGAPSP
jgi:hypothetical protein